LRHSLATSLAVLMTAFLLVSRASAGPNDELVAAASAGDLERVKAHVSRGANVNATDSNGKSALMLASATGNVEVVRLLLTAGAQVNAVTPEGDTALMAAAFRGHLQVVRILIARGADPNLRTSDGWTARTIAEAKGHREVAGLLTTGVKPGAQGESAHPTGSANAAPAGKIVIAQGVDPTTLDMANQSETPASNVGRHIFDTLYERDRNMKIVPALAADMPKFVPPSVWEVKLRTGVKFHNGEDFDADSAKFALERPCGRRPCCSDRPRSRRCGRVQPDDQGRPGNHGREEAPRAVPPDQ